MWRGDTAYPHLISVGGPGVNMIFDYYNDMLPARFDPTGGWHIVTPTREYWKTVDGSGRTIEDYAIIALHYDGAKDSYVLLIGGIGAEGSVAASISIADRMPLRGEAVVIKVSDGDGDGVVTFWSLIHRTENIEIVETIG